MEPGTESLAILFVIVIATLLTYWISNFNLVTMFPGLTTIGAFVILWNFLEKEPIYLKEERCPKCGNWSKTAQKYCDECGKKLS